MGRPVIDLKGQKFNNLTVLHIDSKWKGKGIKWICLCDCENITSVSPSALKNGTIKGCGCLKGKCSKYKYPNKRLYKIWSHMKSRCENSKDISYKNYGAIGISICDEWQDYDNFAKWSLNNGYKESLEIDRINVYGKYEPLNCRWVTRVLNARNKRNTFKFFHKEKLYTIGELAEMINISPKLFWQKMNRDKKSVSEIMGIY